MNRIIITLLLSITLIVSAEYQLVWQDEFNGNALDGSKWQIEQDCSGGGNNELQCYTNKQSNVRVGDGFLHVTARAENYNGKSYTSGRLNTKHSAAWKYGRFDIRAKLPRGDYLWPALWMLPRDSVYGGWAASGEIDIMEARGQSTTKIESTLHHGGSWPNNVYTGSGPVTFPFDFSADFHLFSCIWEKDQIQFLIDGKVFSTQNLNRNWYSGRGNSPYNANRQPFDQPFFFIINLAIGGGFFGAQSNALTQQIANQWPSASLVVDYVRVYQDNGVAIVNPVPAPVLSSQQQNVQPVKTSISQESCNGRCGNGLSCCFDKKNGQLCFDPNVHVCAADGLNNGDFSLCGKGLGSCASICYDTNIYTCSSGKIVQKNGNNNNNAPVTPTTPKPADTPAPTKIVTPSNACPQGCGSGSCCNDGRNGGICYDPKKYVCATDKFVAKEYLCPVGSGSCKGACFDSSKYTCSAGKINLL
jgi:beta-glucanase (GH16 family)